MFDPNIAKKLAQSICSAPAQTVEKPIQAKVLRRKACRVCARRRKEMGIIFSGGVYVGENTARLANVRRACPSCAAASRSPFKRRAQ
mgnify:CR=1 FL=1